MSLARYQQKRDFKVTPEPAGAAPTARAKTTARRFVVQKHAASHLHYDLRLELGGVLLSWAVPKGPSLNPADRRLAVHVEDHPVEYRDFEGIIPEGEYGGGSVIVWDRGEWTPEGDPDADYQRGRLKFRLAGEKLRGGFSLVRMHGRRGERGADNWLLLKQRDDEADADGERLVRDRPDSVLSGRSVEAVAAEPARVWGSKARTTRARRPRAARPAEPAPPPPSASPTALAPAGRPPPQLAPALATLVETAPAGPAWLHEVKYDGYRLLARIDGDDLRLLTRRGEDWSPRFPWLVEALRARVPLDRALLDGELVHLGADGITRFGELQRALSEGRHDPLVYFAFDLLHLQGIDLRPLPLDQRKQLLAELLPVQPRPGRVRLSEHILGQGAPLLERACRLGLEGVISKRRDAPYRSGRHRDWLKIKCGQRQEAVIGGFNPARSGGRKLGALLLGVYDDAGALIYCGKVGSGLDFAGAAALRERLEPLITRDSPFERRPPVGAHTRFVRPAVVAELSFSGWTRDGRMRHPVFEGLREDRRPAEVHRERPLPLTAALTRAPPPAARRGAPSEVPGMPLSHPERVLFPADDITKRGLAEYYAATAPWILPWIAGRPLSVLRCPDGVAKPCFFQRHLRGELPPGVRAADLDGEDGDPYLYIDDARGLLGLVQLGVIELHVWGSTVARPDDPDRLVIDLDPDDAVPWARVRDTALAVRARLEDLGLRSFLKTTGGKGLHVVAPLTPGAQTWDQVKAFARGVAHEFARAAPALFTAAASKAGRAGKIYVDYLRNYRGSTSVAPYSVRARPGAPVSAPLAWDELATLASSQVFTLTNLGARLNDDIHGPWRELPNTRQSLHAAALRDVTGKRR